MSSGLKTFLIWIAVQTIIIGGAAIHHPEWYSSGAYELVLDLMPLRWWGILMVVTGLTALTARFYHHPIRKALVVVVLALYCFTQLAFAYSIMSLTWKGFEGSFAGAIMWGGYAYFAWRNLHLGVNVNERD